MREMDTISILGCAYTQSILNLYENAYKESLITNRNRDAENGFSTSCIVLNWLMFESYLVRAQCLLRPEISDFVNDNKTIFNLLKDLWAGDQELNKKIDLLNEVYVVRNVIAHNHLWYIKESGEKELWGPTHSKKIYNLFVNDGKTVKLGLNACPTQILYSDLKFVVRVLLNALVDLIYTPINGRKNQIITNVHTFFSYSSKDSEFRKEFSEFYCSRPKSEWSFI